MVWEQLDSAIARDAEPDELLAIFGQDPAGANERGRSTFAGLQDAMDEAWRARLRAADQLVQEDRFAEAQVAFETLASWFPERANFVARAAAAGEWQKQMEIGEPWTEPVLHLFIHSLIIRPELAFDGDYQDVGYREYMITRLEFTRMLDQMLDRHFVLVDIRDLYEVDEDGNVTQRHPNVPHGKTPFVFSIDDVSYYEYMEGNGFAERLQIDDDLNVATVVVQDDGSEVVTLDGDAMPILDQFVLDHPQFSLGGAKGILAVTGYEGVFGWDFSRDQVDHPDFERRRATAGEIADRLSETGWAFASHSYTHGNWIASPASSFGRFRFDADNWEAEIAPVLGGTDIYISPFGYWLSDSNPRFDYLMDEKGFNVFAPISDGLLTEFHDKGVIMHRLAVDGYMLREAPERLAPWFDAGTVIDEARGLGE